MALIKCGECGKEISDKAKACPACGAPIKEKQTVSQLISAVLVVIVAGFFIHACNSDDTPSLTDTDEVTCDTSTLLQNGVNGASAVDLVSMCNDLAGKIGHQPTYGLLKSTANAAIAFQLKGYGDDLPLTAKKLVNIVALRGQINNGDEAFKNNYDMVFKMYTAWDREITPDTVYGFLSHAGVLAKTTSDKGLVGIMATIREQQ
ncbi:Uncharacterised protein [Serratia plymuthica]|nr:Uncharacterised protein [Serratia plymuthica]